MLTEQDATRLGADVDEILRWARTLSVTRLGTPTNLAEQRRLVLDSWARGGQIYTPEFIYGNELSDRAGELEKQSTTVGNGQTRIDALVRESSADFFETLKVVASKSSDRITEHTVSKYGAPSEQLLRHANEIVAEAPSELHTQSTVSAEDAATHLRTGLEALDFTGWVVTVEDEMHAKMSVNSAEQKVKIRQGLTFTTQAVDRLIVHEIGTHVARFEHAKSQRLDCLRVPFGVSEPTEEGLAVFNEERAGLVDPADMRKYALRVVGTALSLEAGFAEVFRELVNVTEPEQAVDIAIRCKRGFKDVNNVGSHVKDISYLKGYLMMRDENARDPGLLAVLYTCKQPLENVELVRSLISEGWLEYCQDPITRLENLHAS